jgi:hypothetical protein
VEVEQRCADAQLSAYEPSTGDRRGAGGRPAESGRDRAARDQRLDRGEDAGQGGHQLPRAKGVDRGCVGGVDVLRQQAVPKGEHDHGHRYGDEEDRAPPRKVQQHATDHRPEGRERERTGGPRRHRLLAGALIGEELRDECERRRHQRGAGHPLDHPGQDQDRSARGEGGDQ